MIHYYSLIGLVLIFSMAINQIIRPIKTQNMILAGFFFAVSIIQLFLYLFHTDLLKQIPHLFLVNVPFMFISGPLLYYYFLVISSDTMIRWNKKIILHFIPALFVIIALWPAWLLNTADKIKGIDKLFYVTQYQIHHILTFLGLISIFIYMIVLCIQYRSIWVIGNIAHKKMLHLSLLLFLGIASSVLFMPAVIKQSILLFRAASFVFTSNIIVIYFLSQKYPYLLHNLNLNLKYQKSIIKKINLQDLRLNLLNLMENERCYCDEDLTLNKLALFLDITPHQLSQYLNDRLNKNFNQFINEFRIAEAKKLLIENQKRSVISIAFAVGFNSNSSFYLAFKNIAGISPAAFRNYNSGYKINS